MNEDTITIPLSEYQWLLKGRAAFDALQSCNKVNWDDPEIWAKYQEILHELGFNPMAV